MVGSLVQSVVLPALLGDRAQFRRSDKTCAVARVTVSNLQLSSSSIRFSGTRVLPFTFFLGTKSILRGQVMHSDCKQTGRVAVEAMFPVFTEKAIEVIMLAQEESRQLGCNYVGAEHLLLGLLRMEPSLAATVLKHYDINIEDARILVERITGRGMGFVAVQLTFTPRAKRIMGQAWVEARQLGHDYLGPEHLLHGLLAEEEGVPARVLKSFGVDPSEMHTTLTKVLHEFGESTNAVDAAVGDGSSGREMTTPVKNLCDKVGVMEDVGKIAFAEGDKDKIGGSQ